MSILKKLAAFAIIFLPLLSHAQAADQWSDWAAGIKVAIKKTEAARDIMEKKIRDVRCPQQAAATAQEACNAAYNTILARMDLELAEMRLKVAATSLPPQQRDYVIKNILRGYDELVRETNWMGDEFDSLFPIPHRSSQR